MTEHTPPYLFDVPAVRFWADASGNESKTILNAVQSGIIHIYNRIWDNAQAAYPDECSTIPKSQFKCERCTDEHRLASAAMAERLQAAFPIRGSHDDAVEWSVVGIARCGRYTIVTDERRKKKYQKVDGLLVITYTELIKTL